MKEWTLAHLGHPDATIRQSALEKLPYTRSLGYVLRDLILFEELAPLRALAAERLGRSKDPTWAFWLQELLADPLQTVREAACHGLIRLGSMDSVPDLHEAATSDPNWRVRRAATTALIACQGAQAIDNLREVLFDPFWRVRHSAVKGLQWIGDLDSSLRDLILSPLPHLEGQQALRYLRFQWQVPEEHTEAQAPTIKDEIPLSPPLDNLDPAVVAKDLIEKPNQNYSSKDLCYLLADSHEALRKAAHKILLNRDANDLIPILHWLEIPGPPRAAEQSLKLLHDIRKDALPLVEYALQNPSHGSPGATVWALGWVIQNRHESLFKTVLECSTHIDERVRQSAAAGLSELLRSQLDNLQGDMQQRLLELLSDSSPRVIKDALFGLLNSEDSEVLNAIGQLKFQDQIPNARVSLLHWAQRNHRKEWIDFALSDPHPAVRSSAVVILDEQSALTEESRKKALKDEDPWVRAAALNSLTSQDALHSDSSPVVRRAAARVLARDGELSQDQRFDIAARLAAQSDPSLRARATAFLQESQNTGNTESLTLALTLSQDEDLRVRASIREALDQWPDALTQLLTLVKDPEINVNVAKAAWSRLIKENKERVGPILLDALNNTQIEDALKEHLTALSLIFSDQNADQFKAVPGNQKKRKKVIPPNIELRELGRTGLKVSPLAISGAQQLPYSCYRDAKEAGVNLFFWEPLYTELTRFLRGSQGQSCQVIAGTFHAHKDGIVKDVETALRRLKRDSLDVFLYFWARSDRRLNDEAFEIMQELKRQGKIKACGFSTHHREMALEAIQNNPWDVLMTRHNAAHLGSEKELFPAARELGVGVLTFSNLCYGRMLKRPESAPHLTPPSAADCYRYSLSQPGVSASISAPRRFRELEENLAVLKNPTLNDADLDRLRVFGAEVYTGNKGFNKLIRQPGMMKTLRELALAAIERDMGLPPSSSEGPRPLSSDIMDQVQKDESQQLPASLPSAVIRRGRK